MRKGYSLIELLIVIVILPILFLVMSGFITTIFSDIPRSGKRIHDNSVMLIMLEQMEQDIDAAIDLPQSINGYTAGNELLLIEQADKVIHYQLKDNYVYRYGFSDNQQIPKDTRYWLLPEAKIK